MVSAILGLSENKKEINVKETVAERPQKNEESATVSLVLKCSRWTEESC